MVDDNKDDVNQEIDDEQTDSQPVEESNDLRSALEAAVKEHSEEPSEPSTAAARARDERGRFASANQVSEPATRTEASEAPSEPIAPPYSWSAEQKELFSQLPRQMQEYVSKREQERESLIGRKSQETTAIKQKYAQVDRLVEQYGDTFKRANLDPMQGIENLILAQQYLDKDPVGALQLMAQSYGLDLSQLASNTEQPVQQQAFPQMHYLTSELDSIRSKLAAYEQEKSAQQQRAAVNEVESFANEMDSSGTLIRPFIGDVHEQMMDEVRLIRSRNPEMPARQVLQQAYETSCWKNPEVRTRLIEQQRQPQAQAARVQQAKLAGSSVRGAPGASSLANTNGNSVRDALMAAMEMHT